MRQYVHESDPLSLMTMAQCWVAHRVVELFRSAERFEPQSIEPGPNIIAKA